MNAPQLRLEVEPDYVMGFPMLVALTVENGTNVDFLNLPQLTVQTPVDSVAITFAGRDGARTIGPSLTMRDEGLLRTTLMARERKRFLFDMASLGFELPAGVYQLTASLQVTETVKAGTAPARVELKAPGPQDAMELTRMRLALGQVRAEPIDWQRFINTVPHTLTPPAMLSERAAQQLAYHLFLSDAAATRNVASIPTSNLVKMRGPVLEPEAELLKLELAVLAGNRRDADRMINDIRGRWPALGYRLQSIVNSAGPIAVAREIAGVGGPAQ